MSRGGWRSGAGRPASHAKTGQYLSLDVRDLQRRGLLDLGVSFSWQWSRYGEQVGNIGIRISEQNAVHLDFQRNGNSEHVKLELEHTACNYGGTRPWFNCPRCSSRVAIVYLSIKPSCRNCLRLHYPSQSDDAIARSWGRTGEVMRKLGLGMRDFPHRPKGMRQGTFDRLQAAWLREDDFRDQALTLFVAHRRDLLR